jgi:hypothetical protein
LPITNYHLLSNQSPFAEWSITFCSVVNYRLQATVTDVEYGLITSVAGANVCEPLRVPEAAAWLQRRHLPGADKFDGDDAGVVAGEAASPRSLDGVALGSSLRRLSERRAHTAIPGAVPEEVWPHAWANALDWAPSRAQQCTAWLEGWAAWGQGRHKRPGADVQVSLDPGVLST